MYTIGDLADELNRQEWAVERMLKNRGYLKQNGEPRKSTIDDGLMNKNGLITKLGWSTFIDELGYKETDEDEEDDDDIIDEDDDSADDDGDWNDDSDDEEDDENDWNDYSDDEEMSDEEYNAKLRSELESEGHTEAYIRKALEIQENEPSTIYEELSEEDAKEDFCARLDAAGYSEQTKNFFEALTDSDGIYEDGFFENIETFDKAFWTGMEHYNDESRALDYAEYCWNKHEIIEINEEFESFVREYEPWLKIVPFGEYPEYDADALIDEYYYNDGYKCCSYGDGDEEVVFFYDDEYRSKSSIEDENASDHYDELKVEAYMEKYRNLSREELQDLLQVLEANHADDAEICACERLLKKR